MAPTIDTRLCPQGPRLAPRNSNGQLWIRRAALGAAGLAQLAASGLLATGYPASRAVLVALALLGLVGLGLASRSGTPLAGAPASDPMQQAAAERDRQAIGRHAAETRATLAASAEAEVAAGAQVTAIEEASLFLEDLATTIQQVANNTDTLAAGMNNTYASIEEIAAAIEQVSHHVVEMLRVEERTARVASEGQVAVGVTIEGMDLIDRATDEIAEEARGLDRQSSEIDEITRLIGDIADRTNLLALNTAIEAARAGEHGRGFAVVADQVKKLADGASQASKAIAARICGMQAHVKRLTHSARQGEAAVEEGRTRAVHAGEALQAIVTATDQGAGLIRQIAQASGEQREAAQVITHTVDRMNRMTQRVSKATAAQRQQTDRVVDLIEALDGRARAVLATVGRTRSEAEAARAHAEAAQADSQAARPIDDGDGGCDRAADRPIERTIPIAPAGAAKLD